MNSRITSSACLLCLFLLIAILPLSFGANAGVVPSAPTSVTASSVNGQVVISWQSPTYGSVFNYEIYRGTASGMMQVMYDTQEHLIQGTSYTDASAQPGQQYYYYVVAMNSNGQMSTPSDTVTVTAPVIFPPNYYTSQSNNNSLIIVAFVVIVAIIATVGFIIMRRRKRIRTPPLPPHYQPPMQPPGQWNYKLSSNVRTT